MARAGFYLIFIDRNLDASKDQVQAAMNSALDWYRITSKVWVVYTTSDAEKWYGRLERLVKQGGNVFICKLDIKDRQGWMSKEFWRWLRETEDKYQEQHI